MAKKKTKTTRLELTFHTHNELDNPMQAAHLIMLGSNTLKHRYTIMKLFRDDPLTQLGYVPGSVMTALNRAFMLGLQAARTCELYTEVGLPDVAPAYAETLMPGYKHHKLKLNPEGCTCRHGKVI